MDQPELEFRSALQEAVSECRRIGYQPTGFMGMITSTSAFEAVRSLLAKRNPSDGFTHLWEKGRLDLSVEAIVLKPEWRGHFAPQEIQIARRRLAEVNYRAPWDAGDTAIASGNPDVGTLLAELAASEGNVAAGKRIRSRLRALGHYGGLRERESDIERGVARATVESMRPGESEPVVLPPVPEAAALVERIRSLVGLPERNHEDVVKDLLLRLGFGASAIVFQRGRIDLCVLAEDRRTAAVFEVKRTIAVESERAAARRQGMDYAGQTGALMVVITDGDRYEIYDRRRGHDYETMLCGRFQITSFRGSDVPALDLLRPDSLCRAG